MDISQWIERRAGFSPDKVAVHFEGADITYARMADRIRHLARALKRLGVGRGDRVAFLGFNSPEFLELVFACARLGAMVVPLNWRLTPAEHLYILQDSGTFVLFCEPEFTDHMAVFKDEPGDNRLVAYGRRKDGWLHYDTLISEAQGDDRNPHVDLSAPLLVVYTSGTTGHPKGAVLTQEALFWNAVNSTCMHDLTSRDRVLTVLPLFHVGGLNILTLPALHAGATVTLQRRFDPGECLRLIGERKPTLNVQVPATILALTSHPDWESTDLSSLRMMTTGSQVVPDAQLKAFCDRGVPAIQVYGSTETGPIAIYLPPEDAERKMGSTGKPAPHCEAKLVDRDGKEITAPNVPGEILLRGPNLLYEYWSNAEATEEALQGGWYHTGDIAHVDEEGYYYVDDRKKDVIISGGENIYPAELENILADCPKIAEAAVVARADDKWGEIPVAAVVLKAGEEMTADEVTALFEGRLAGYKLPKDVVFLEALPRNAMGKLLKYIIRKGL